MHNFEGMNLANFYSSTKWLAIIGLLAIIVVSTEGCRSKGHYGTHKRGGGRGCDCPSIGH